METNLAQLIHHIVDDKSPQLAHEASKQLERIKINDPINLILSFLDFLSVNIYTTLDKTQVNSLTFAAVMVGKVLMVSSTQEHQAYWAGIPEYIKDKIKKKLSISVLKNHSIEVNRQLGMIIGSIASLPQQGKKDDWFKQTMSELFGVDNQTSLYSVLIILRKYFERSIELNWLQESEIVNTLVYGFKIKNIQIRILTLQTFHNYILKYDIIKNKTTEFRKILQPLYQSLCQLSKNQEDDYIVQSLKILSEILKYRLPFFVPTLNQLYNCLQTIVNNKAKNTKIFDDVITIVGSRTSQCFNKSMMKLMYKAVELMITYIQRIDLHLYNTQTKQAQTRYLPNIQQAIENKVELVKQQMGYILKDNYFNKNSTKKASLNYLENRAKQLIEQGQMNCFVASILIAYFNSYLPNQIQHYFKKFTQMFKSQSIPLKYIACWGLQSICEEGNDFIDKKSCSIYMPLITSLLSHSPRVSIKSCHALCSLLKHCTSNGKNQEDSDLENENETNNQESRCINFPEIKEKILYLIIHGQPSLQIHYLDCLIQCCYFFPKETIGKNIEQLCKFLMQLIQQHLHLKDKYACMMICKATCALYTVMKRVQNKLVEEDWNIALSLMMEIKEWVFEERKCADWVIEAGVEVVLKVDKHILLQNWPILKKYLHLIYQNLTQTHNRVYLSPPPQNPQSKPNNKDLSDEQQKYIIFLRNFNKKLISTITIEDLKLQVQKYQIVTDYFKQYLLKLLLVDNYGIFIAICPIVHDYCQEMRRLKGEAAVGDVCQFVGGLMEVVDPDAGYQIVNVAVFTLKSIISQQLTSSYLTKNQCSAIFAKVQTLFWNYSLKIKFERQSQSKCLRDVVSIYGNQHEKDECLVNIMHFLILIIKKHYAFCQPYIEIAMYHLVPFQLSLDTQDIKLRAKYGLLFISQFLEVLHGWSLQSKIEGAEALITNLLKTFRFILENEEYRSQINQSIKNMRKSYQILNQIRQKYLSDEISLSEENWAEVGALLKM